MLTRREFLKKYKWITWLSIILLTFTTLTLSCSKEQYNTSKELIFNSAIITAAATDMYTSYDDVSDTIIKHAPQMSVDDQNFIKEIALRFANVKDTLDSITKGKVDIYKVTIDFNKYYSYYTLMSSDYTVLKEILNKNKTLFSASEWSSLVRFDNEFSLLSNQVNLLKTKIKDTMDDQKQIEITEIVQTTLTVLKTVSTLALIMAK